MFKHTIKLHGSHILHHGVSSLILRDLLNIITEGSIRALRLRLEGRSTVTGKLPSWLDTATDFEVIISNPTEVEIDAPPLIKAAPERFGQSNLFSDVDVSKSSLVLFEDSLED